MTQEEIFQRLSDAAPLKFKYDRSKRFCSSSDESMIASILGGTMHKNAYAPYDFEVDGQMIDLKYGKSINMSCKMHDDLDIDYLVISKDGTSASYITAEEFKEIDYSNFRPSCSHSYCICEKTSSNYDKAWPIVIVYENGKETQKAEVVEVEQLEILKKNMVAHKHSLSQLASGFVEYDVAENVHYKIGLSNYFFMVKNFVPLKGQPTLFDKILH